MSTAHIDEIMERAARRAKRVARDHGEQGSQQDVKMPRIGAYPGLNQFTIVPI